MGRWLCPFSPLMIAGPPAGSSYWSWLPEECKGLVLRHLDSKDLAKAARTSKEFADHIRAVRAGLGVLNVPPGEFSLTGSCSCQHFVLDRLEGSCKYFVSAGTCFVFVHTL